MVKFVRALRRHPTLWVGPRFPYIWEIPYSSLQGSSKCAWHDAEAVFLAERLEVKSPAVTGMIKVGFKPKEAHWVWIRINKWQLVYRRAVRFTLNLEWFRKQGLVFLNDFTKRSLEQPLFSH